MILLTPNISTCFAKQAGIVDIWYADLAQLKINQAACHLLLDGVELSFLAGLQFDSMRDAYVQGHGLLRKVLGGYLQVSPASLNIQRTQQGKPFLVDYPWLTFNLSHSGSKWLLAVTEGVQLGVDIEEIKPRKLLAGLVARCFAPEEQDYWNGLTETAQLPNFFYFWTRKEAFVKAVGRGIALGLDQCVIDVADPQHFLRVPLECGHAEAWSVKDLKVDDTCCAAVAAKLPFFKVRGFAVTDAFLHFV